VLPWADGLIFWGLNAGVAAFIVVFAREYTFFERFTAPVMGLAILLGLVTFTLRLWTRASQPGFQRPRRPCRAAVVGRPSGILFITSRTERGDFFCSERSRSVYGGRP